MIYIGIDTGVNTGFAVWDTTARSFLQIETVPLHRALWEVYNYKDNPFGVKVFFEDARQRKWIPNSHDIRTEMGRRQGAGSVKRDSKIWEDFCKDAGIAYEAVAPRRNTTKMEAEPFARLTGWKGRTSKHSRDAAMLVFGR